MNDHHTMVYRLMENYKILKETVVIIIITIFNSGRFVDDATNKYGFLGNSAKTRVMLQHSLSPNFIYEC